MTEKRILATKENVDEIREELKWHMNSLMFIMEQEYIKQFAPKEKEEK